MTIEDIINFFSDNRVIGGIILFFFWLFLRLTWFEMNKKIHDIVEKEVNRKIEDIIPKMKAEVTGILAEKKKQQELKKKKILVINDIGNTIHDTVNEAYMTVEIKNVNELNTLLPSDYSIVVFGLTNDFLKKEEIKINDFIRKCGNQFPILLYIEGRIEKLEEYLPMGKYLITPSNNRFTLLARLIDAYRIVFHFEN